MMIAVLTITLPIFLLIGVGYSAVRLRFLTLEQNSGLGSYVLNFAYPAVVFLAISQQPVAQLFNPDYLIAYVGATLLVFWLGLAFFYTQRGRSAIQASLDGMAMTFSNTGFIGYPILSQILGPIEAAVFLAMNVMVENMFVVMPTIVIGELSQGQKQHPLRLLFMAFKKILSSPPIIALLLGITFSVLGLGILAPVKRVLEMLAMAAAPVALFVIGANLNAVRVIPSIKNALPTSVGKLVVFPTLVFALFKLGEVLTGELDGQLMMIAIVSSATPVATLYALIGFQYGEGKACSGNLVVMTLLSFFSLSTALALWGYFYGLPSGLPGA